MKMVSDGNSDFQMQKEGLFTRSGKYLDEKYSYLFCLYFSSFHSPFFA